MTEEVKTEVVEELHDDQINDDIVEETLDEAAPVAKAPKGDEGAVTEPESVASVDKAADAVKSQAPVPKTKAGMISAMYSQMNGMKKADLMAAYKKVMGEEVEVEESDVIAETQIDTTAELDALVESEATLSDEFKAKTAVIFEAAVKSKLSEEVDRIEAQYKEELEEEVSSTKSELVEKVDSYLNYVVESWMEENKVAVQNGLRTEIAETFMNKMKDLFVESYIEVPESKVDLVDELAGQVEELEEKLNSQTGESIKLSEELETYKRESIIAEATRDMAETQVEKLKGLIENVDFDDEESFKTKVATVKESFFKTETNSQVEEIMEDEAEADATVEVSSVMESYLNTIRKTANK
jgi:hypothetical protein